MLPALLLVIGISSLLIRLLSPDPGVYRGSGWRASIGMRNVPLYMISGDYFGQTISLNPLTHPCSLGVEKQHYFERDGSAAANHQVVAGPAWLRGLNNGDRRQVK